MQAARHHQLSSQTVQSDSLHSCKHHQHICNSNNIDISVKSAHHDLNFATRRSWMQGNKHKRKMPTGMPNTTPRMIHTCQGWNSLYFTPETFSNVQNSRATGQWNAPVKLPNSPRFTKTQQITNNYCKRRLPGNVDFAAFLRTRVPKQLPHKRVHNGDLKVIFLVTVHAVTETETRKRWVEVQ